MEKIKLYYTIQTCNLVTKDVEISYTSEGKFLGINISNNLKWNTHIQFLYSKLNKVSYMTLSLRSKAIPLQAWTGPEGSRGLRLPDLKTIGT